MLTAVLLCVYYCHWEVNCLEQKQRFDSLTALKGLFILIIVLHNSFLIQPLFDSVPGVAFIRLFGGDLGNSMFFILSGFLMSIGYRERIGQGQISFGSYLSRRIQKFYPLYLITNAAALLVGIIQYGVSVINLKKIAFTLLIQSGGMTQDGPYNSPTWFLGALFVCYVVFYFVCYHTKYQTQYRCSLALCIALGYALILNKPEIPFLYESTGIGLMNFFIGCALAEIYPKISAGPHPWLPWGSLAALLIFLGLMFTTGIEIICGECKIAFSFVICPLVLYLAVANRLCEKVLRLKPLVWLGKISTSIFFWHLVLFNAYRIVVEIITHGSVVSDAQFVLYLVILLVWSAISERFEFQWHWFSAVGKNPKD